MWGLYVFFLVLLLGKLIFSCFEFKDFIFSSNRGNVTLDADPEAQRRRHLSSSNNMTSESSTVIRWIDDSQGGVNPSDCGPPTYSECERPPKYEEALKKCKQSREVILSSTPVVPETIQE